MKIPGSTPNSDSALWSGWKNHAPVRRQGQTRDQKSGSEKFASTQFSDIFMARKSEIQSSRRNKSNRSKFKTATAAAAT